MQILEVIFYFIVTLGVLVFVHELGHFLAAKLCGMRVERFSIGFPPRAFGKQIGETDYCVSWIPIGGYVKIAGMVDESFDTEYAAAEPDPREFRAKPLWQKLLVLSAGVIMNLLLAIAIFWAVTYSQGRAVRETTRIGFVDSGSPAAVAGLQAGDSILSVNGKQVTTWEDLQSDIFVESLSSDVMLQVLRDASTFSTVIPRGSLPETGPAALGISPAGTEIVIGSVSSGRPADALGLKPMDVILRINGHPVGSDSSVMRLVRSNAGKPISVEWRRGDTLMSGSTTVADEGIIGITFSSRSLASLRRINYTVFGALPPAVSEVATYTELTVRVIGQIITGKTELSRSVGGPIRIAQMATQTAELGILPYLWFMAVLSISLALFNILPIPALDGGHILLVLIEGIMGRELPIKAKLAVQRVGFFLLLAFMAFVLYNDIMKF